MSLLIHAGIKDKPCLYERPLLSGYYVCCYYERSGMYHDCDVRIIGAGCSYDLNSEAVDFILEQFYN